ncbi:MAG TPA: hypothetical protein VFI62_06030 [Burkholderiales bacterium]|nr:hypothetical protein [Burkholderiales bacterium]
MKHRRQSNVVASGIEDYALIDDFQTQHWLRAMDLDLARATRLFGVLRDRKSD